MAANQALVDGWTVFKSGTLWKAYARFNPKESKTLDNYVLTVAAGKEVGALTLRTATGRGLYRVIRAMVLSRAAVVSQANLEVPEKKK